MVEIGAEVCELVVVQCGQDQLWFEMGFDFGGSTGGWIWVCRWTGQAYSITLLRTMYVCATRPQYSKHTILRQNPKKSVKKLISGVSKVSKYDPILSQG